MLPNDELVEQEQQEDWPTDSMWFECEIVKNYLPSFAVGHLTNGQEVHISRRAVSLSPGGHLCEEGLPPGTICSVRIQRSPEGHHMDFTCIELRCDEEPDTLEEQGVIECWKPNASIGSVMKPCGKCAIFALTKGRSETYSFQRGDPVFWTLERSNRKEKPQWIAKNITPLGGENAPEGDEENE